jgi:hypothetical protein
VTMSLRGAPVATKQSPRQWETASQRSQRHTRHWCNALEAQLKSAQEERGWLVQSAPSQVEGPAKVGGQYGE